MLEALACLLFSRRDQDSRRGRVMAGHCGTRLVMAQPSQETNESYDMLDNSIKQI